MELPPAGAYSLPAGVRFIFPCPSFAGAIPSRAACLGRDSPSPPGDSGGPCFLNLLFEDWRNPLLGDAKRTVSAKRYLNDEELGRAKGAPALPEGRKYLSSEELRREKTPSSPTVNPAPPRPAPPLDGILSGKGGTRGAMPSPESIQAREEKKRKGEAVRPATQRASLEETRPERPTAPAPTPAPAPAPVVAAAFSGPGALPRRNAPPVQELSPLSDGVLAHLRSRLPETLNILSPEESALVMAKLRAGGAYTIGSQLARGAESILYQGYADGYNFLVKSIRNWKDHWLGDVRTRKDVGRLSSGVAYPTKVRHLTNEWNVGQNFQEDAGQPIPVQFYSLRRVSRLGLELGWDLLMERINGVDLSDRRLLSVLTLTDKVKLCIRMAQAISVLHLRRFIHLDIKPSNFMLDRQGRIRLIDFGISVPSGFQSRTVAGTAGYFSPEQISCRPLGDDTDIFALGITFNVLFGGRILIQSPEEAKSRQFRHDAASDLEKNTLPAVADIPELPASCRPLAEVIRECTIYRRMNRIGNCTQLISRLRQAAAQCGLAL